MSCGWECLSYCLMRNHVHLLIRTPRPNLAEGMRKLLGRYAQIFNERHALVTHLFHRPFGSRRSHDDASTMYLSAYVALNPVRAGLANDPAEHPWSSHAGVAGRRKAPGWLAVDALLELFGGDPRRYASLVEAIGTLGGAGFDPITATHASFARTARPTGEATP